MKNIFILRHKQWRPAIVPGRLKTKQAEQLTDLNSGIVSFDLVNNKLVFAKTEAWPIRSNCTLQTPPCKNATRISNFNYDWVQKKQLSFPDKKTFTNDNGQTIEYWVMKPVNYQAGKKFPLLLNIHGGPSAMWGPGETSMWHEFQFWCSKGYGVVYCNPRGSGGYGLDFLRANINDWGTGPTSDVLTALDKTVEKVGPIHRAGGNRWIVCRVPGSLDHCA